MNKNRKLTLPPGPLTQAYLALDQVYVETHRHREALDAVKRTLLGGATTGRHSGLTIIGPTGSGKSATVSYAERWLRAEMALPEDAPSPLPLVLMTTRSTGRTIANNILRAARDPLAGTRTQDDAETLIRETSSGMEVVGFALDEFHHAFAGKSESEALRMSLTLKTLVNSLSKPMVVIGVDELDLFLDGNAELRQRFERRVYLDDPTVSSEQDLNDMRKVLKAMSQSLPCEAACELDTKEMLIRLLYASRCRFGSVVNMVKSACEWGAMDGEAEVRLEHFVNAYHQVAPKNRRKPEDNAFLMPLDMVKQLVKQMQSEATKREGRR